MSFPIEVYAQILEDQPVVIERFKYDSELYKEQPKIGEKILHNKTVRGIEDITFEWNLT